MYLNVVSMIAALMTVGQMPRFVLERDTLTLADRGYVLGAPTHVAGPGAFSFHWSPDGRYLAALSRSVAPQDRLAATIGKEVPIRESIVVWDGKGDSATNVAELNLKGSPDHYGEEGMEVQGWMAGSALILEQFKLLPSGPQRNEPEAEFAVYRWTAGQSKASKIISGKTPFQVFVSRKQPYGLLCPQEPVVPRASGRREDEDNPAAGFLFGPTGNPRPVAIPQTGVVEDKAGYFWSSETTPLTPGATKHGQDHWKRLNLNGVWEAQANQPDIDPEGYNFGEGEDEPQDPNGIRISVGTTAAAHGPVKTQVQSAWLWAPVKGVIHAALVAAETTGVSLSPTKDKIAYVSQEHLMVRALEPLSLKELNLLLEASERQLLLSNGKQIALSIIMYSADYDDNYPANAGWQDAVRPYLKNDSIFTGFVYEMNGENAAKIDEPAKKRMGYIQGAHGRVLVYSDGHAVWESKNP